MDDGSKGHLAYAEGGVTAPEGFLAASVAVGLKRSGRKDISLLYSERPCSVAGVFTTNQIAAAPVLMTKEHVADGTLQAVVANSGNANACSGAKGLFDARTMARAAAEALGLRPDDVAVASTGVIGRPLPMDLVLEGIAEAAEILDSNAGTDAAEGIMTTDTFPKETGVTVAVGGRRYTVGGMAKGSGMIRPDMATMLAFLTTDAPLDAAACDSALRTAVDATFNRVTVDGETSTNDCVLLLANGAAGGEGIGLGDEAYDVLAGAVRHVCAELARMIVRDGEGATKLVEVTVRGAVSDDEALTGCWAIADSPLVKTALFGGDPNWGRVASAIGASKCTVDPGRFEIAFDGVTVARDGEAVAFDEAAAAAALSGPEVGLVVDLHSGVGAATVWTCDFSYDYVRINAEYDRLEKPIAEERA